MEILLTVVFVLCAFAAGHAGVVGVRAKHRMENALARQRDRRRAGDVVSEPIMVRTLAAASTPAPKCEPRDGRPLSPHHVTPT